MKFKSIFYNCSEEYVCREVFGISGTNQTEPAKIVQEVKWDTRIVKQSDYNILFNKTFLKYNWKSKYSYDYGLGKFEVDFCKTVRTRDVFVEIQFGKTEASLKDLAEFQIAYNNKVINLGILIIPEKPREFLPNRDPKAIGGMAYLGYIENILPKLKYDAPIWIIGLLPTNA